MPQITPKQFMDAVTRVAGRLIDDSGGPMSGLITSREQVRLESDLSKTGGFSIVLPPDWRTLSVILCGQKVCGATPPETSLPNPVPGDRGDNPRNRGYPL